MWVSIHAAREGRDSASSSQMVETLTFQSTRPVKAATCMALRLSAIRPLFQSTRPVKAATPPFEAAKSPSPVSIHAAREGRDLVAGKAFTLVTVSIHAAREGRDGGPCGLDCTIRQVSIHAAREGRDRSRCAGLWR